MVRGFLVSGFVVLASCSPEPGLFELTATPTMISSKGQRAIVRARATHRDGTIGTGKVDFRSTSGSLKSPVVVPLDEFGSAVVDYTCAASEDPTCQTVNLETIKATWRVAQKELTAEATVRVQAPSVTEDRCDNRMDDDEDGLIDCSDPDCETGACSDLNACTTGEVCRRGICGGGSPVTCNTPPVALCAEQLGTCDPVMGCRYPPKNTGLSCDDGSLCTTGDRCTASGRCEGTDVVCMRTGFPCFDPTGACNPTTGMCEFETLVDGTSCGTQRGSRCCDGSCVNISSDRANCGGCFVACGFGKFCEDAKQGGCGPANFGTTGVCSCSSNSDCPSGQECLGTRCSPSNCRPRQNLTLKVDACWGYCTYP